MVGVESAEENKLRTQDSQTLIWNQAGMCRDIVADILSSLRSLRTTSLETGTFGRGLAVSRNCYMAKWESWRYGGRHFLRTRLSGLGDSHHLDGVCFLDSRGCCFLCGIGSEGSGEMERD